MTIDTKPYGSMEIDERQLITFPWGLYGFENISEYALMDARQHPFYWLQSLEVQNIAFVLIDPNLIRPDYNPCLDSIDIEALQLNNRDASQMLQFAIVTIPDDRHNMTANLQGPIIINRESRRGRQCISLDENLGVRHNIVEEIASSSAKNAC